jgi:hypothetical protein
MDSMHSVNGRKLPVVALSVAALLALAVVVVDAAPELRNLFEPERPPVETPASTLHPRAGDKRPAKACEGTAVTPDQDLGAALADGAEGATFCVAAGTYRLRAPLVPRRGQKLLAAPGAVLSGARPVTGWRRGGDGWVGRADLPADPERHGDCESGTICQLAETVFLDGSPLRRVEVRAQLGRGRFWTDYAADRVWIGDDPAGRRTEVAVTRTAVTGRATGVTVAGFVIERFANLAQSGAIDAAGAGWTIRENEIRHNHGVGLNAPGARVLDNHIHHNGQLGLGGGGRGALIEGNEIDHNNTAGFSTEWEAGGSKWVETTGMVVRGNYVHDNAGTGLWTDINNVDTLFERNVVARNSDYGIHHEISYDAVIRDNDVVGNGFNFDLDAWGGAGIRIAASPNVQVTGNVVRGNRNAIMLVQQDRRGDEHPRGPHELRNVRVHGNQVSLDQGHTGLVQDVGDDSYYTSRGNRFEGNDYRLRSTQARSFAWRGGVWDRAGWQRFGQDRAGTFELAR